jgi:hypothetical protein
MKEWPMSLLKSPVRILLESKVQGLLQMIVTIALLLMRRIGYVSQTGFARIKMTQHSEYVSILLS